KDLFEHEMLVAALLRHDGVPKDVGHLALDGPAVEVGQMDPIRRQHRHIAIPEEEHVAGVAQDGRDVAGDEILSVTQSNHGWWSRWHCHNLMWVRTADDGQREIA